MTATPKNTTMDAQAVSAEARPAQAALERLATRAMAARPAQAALERLATRAMGLSGADIERIVRQARLNARRERRSIRYEDLEEGIRLNRPPVPYDLSLALRRP